MKDLLTQGPDDPLDTAHQDQGCLADNKHLRCGWLILHFLVINSAGKVPPTPQEGRQIKILNQTQKRNLKINLRFLKKRPGKIIKACNSQLQLLHFIILGQNKTITPQGIRGSRDAMEGLSMLCRLAATIAKAFQVHGQDVHSSKPAFQRTDSKHLSHFLFMYCFFFFSFPWQQKASANVKGWLLPSLQ